MNDGLLSKGILILAPMKYRAKFPENMFRKKMLSHKINAIFQHRDKKVVLSFNVPRQRMFLLFLTADRKKKNEK